MTSVSVSDLKARLSRYLREVRRGGEVQVLDRGVPVARLTGLRGAAAEVEDRRARLVEAGILRPGRGDAAAVLPPEPLAVPGGLGEALGAVRIDRV
jgi:prevent-host-death family protein